MKIHLPVSLRKALLAAIAAVSYLTVAQPAVALDLQLPTGYLVETSQVVYDTSTIGNIGGVPPGLLPDINYVISESTASGSTFGVLTIHGDAEFRIDHDVSGIQASSIVNNGSLKVDENSVLSVAGNVTAQSTPSNVNLGTVELGVGSSLHVGGNFTSNANTLLSGILSAETGTITLTGASNDLRNGTLSGGTALNITNAILDETTLTSQGDMTLGGSLLVYAPNTVTAVGTLTLNGDLDTPGGSITAGTFHVKAKAFLRSTLVTAGGINIALGTGDLTLNGVTGHTIGALVNAGSFALTNGAEADATTVNNTGTLHIAQGTTLHAQTFTSTGVGNTVISGTLDLTGALSLEGTSNDLDDSVITARQITVNSADNLMSGASLTSETTLNITNATLGNTTLIANGGDVVLSGALTSFGNNSITASGALVINSDLDSNSNTITAQELNVNSFVVWENTTVTVDQTNIAVSPAGLTLSGGNAYQLGIVDNGGTLTLGADTTVHAGIVTNHGSLIIQNTAVFNTGNLTSSGSSEIGGTLVSTGDIVLGGVNNNLNTGSVTATGSITLDSANNSLSQTDMTAGTFLNINNGIFNETSLSAQAGDIILSGSLVTYGGNLISASGVITFEGDYNSINDSLSSHTLNANANVYLINSSVTTEQTNISVSGSLTLVNGTSYTLGTVINSGSLVVRNDGTVVTAGTVTSAGSLVIGEGATLNTDTVVSTGADSSSEITGSLTATGSIALGGVSNNLNQGAVNAGTTLDITNAELGDTRLIAGGDLTLGGTVTDIGNNNVTAGGNLNVTTEASVDIIGGSHVEVGSDLVVEGGLTVNGTLQVTGNTQVSGSGSLTLQETGDSSTFGGTVTVTGNGSLTIESGTPGGTHVVGSGNVTISDSGKGCIINTTYNVDGGNGTITLNDQATLCIIDSTVNGNVLTTNPNATGSTTLILDNAHISKDLTVVGGDLSLSRDNSVGGVLTISDQVTVNVNSAEGSSGTLTVTGGTLINPDASLAVNSDSTFISNVTMTGGSLTINGNGYDATPSFRGDITFAGIVGDENTRTVTVNGDHTQTGSIYVDNDGTINVAEGGNMNLQGPLTFHEGADPAAILAVNEGTTGTLEVSSSNVGFRNDINLAGGTLQINNADEAIGQEGMLYVTGQDAVLRNTAEDARIGKIINTMGEANGLTVDTEADLTLNGAILMDDTDTLVKTGDAQLILAHEEGGSIGILDQWEGDVLISGVGYTVGQLNVDECLTFTSEGGNILSDVTADADATVNLTGENGADTLKGTVVLDGATLKADGTEVEIDSLIVLTNGDFGGTGNLTDVSGTIGESDVEDGSTLHISGSMLTGNTLTTAGTTTINDSTWGLDDTLVTGGVLTLLDDVVLSGDVSVEQGKLHINGTGIVLSSDSTLAFNPDVNNTTNPDSRIIQISSDFDYNGNLAINANGTFLVDNGKTMNVDGSLNGDLLLDKDGDGVLSFNGSAAYTGTIQLTDGTLAATVSNAFGSSSTLAINGDDVVVNTGTQGGSPVQFDADLTVSGDHSFIVDTLADTRWNGKLEGTGGTLNKTGNATLDLTNTGSPGFSTAINLQQGGLAINGSIGTDVDMDAGTVLSGAGVTTGTVTALHDNTIIEIGRAGDRSDIAVLTLGGLKTENGIVNGNNVLKPGTKVIFDVNLDTLTSDLLKVTGKADLNNALLQVNSVDDKSKTKDNTRFRIVESGELLSAFNPTIQHNLDLMNVRLEQVTNGKDVDIVLSINHKGATKTGNQSNVSNAIDGIDKSAIATDELALLVDAFNYTQSEGESKKALEDAGGTRLTTVMASMLAGNHSHLRQLRGSMGSGTASATLLHDGKRSWYETPSTTTVWVDAVNSYNKLNPDGNAPGFKRTAWGGLMGIEQTVRPDSLLLGLSVGYDYARTEVLGGKDDVDNWYFDFYGKWKRGDWSSRASVGMGFHDFTNDRYVNVANSFARQGRGGTDGYSLNMSYELAYAFHVDSSSTLEPLFMVESSAGWIDSYTESGEIGNAGLHVENQDAWSTILGLGVRYGKNFTWVADVPAARVEATAMVTADIGDQGSNVRASYIGAPAYIYNLDSAKRDRIGTLWGVGLTVPMTESFSVFGGSSLEFHSGTRDFTANLGVRYSF